MIKIAHTDFKGMNIYAIIYFIGNILNYSSEIGSQTDRVGICTGKETGDRYHNTGIYCNTMSNAKHWFLKLNWTVEGHALNFNTKISVIIVSIQILKNNIKLNTLLMDCDILAFLQDRKSVV